MGLNHRAALKSEELLRHSTSFSSADGTSADWVAATNLWQEPSFSTGLVVNGKCSQGLENGYKNINVIFFRVTILQSPIPISTTSLNVAILKSF